ncbi:hypothetical protein ElyMa_001958400 [Elysia marginata]|uniref:Uncharacterized protein n=1 Tax=Elysia marginata TaxID=1093978 RepID=A0AAV4EYZ6_9GAST|nr:hypothetical protein ElyMa_001958400 [Elysia marginata]
MAYLPPAGVRYFTSEKMSHLPTMSEIPNHRFMLQKNSVQLQENVSTFELPPLKNRDADWPPPPKSFSPKFRLYDDGSSARCQCLQPPLELGENAQHIGKTLLTKDSKELMPYRLPPQTYDCRRRANWFDNWKEQMARYAGSFALWHQQFGDQYYYTDTACRACRNIKN